MLRSIPGAALGRIVVPERPAKAVAAGLAIAAFGVLVLIVLTPGGLLPGVAESRVEDGNIVVDFEDGDRYFWIQALPANVLEASDLVERIPGEQSITKRSSFDSLDRMAYDEQDGGDDFRIEPDFLYEVSGVFTAATITEPATGPAAGTDFMDQIKEGSNKFTKRLLSFAASIPGIVWDDLKQIRTETKELFTGKPDAEPDEGGGGAQGALSRFLERAKDAWPILVGVVVIVLAAPFLGLDNVFTGAIAAMGLAMAGFWVLAIAAVLAGFLLDDNAEGGGNFVQQLLLVGHVESSSFAERNPAIIGSSILFAFVAAAAGLLSWLGHANWAAIVLLVGGAFIIHLMSGLAKDSKGKLAVGRVGVMPAGVLVVMSALMAFWMARLGFAAYAWALLFFASVMALMAVYQLLGKKRRKRLKEWASTEVADRASGHASKARAFAAKEAEALSMGAKIGIWVLVLFTWMMAVAFATGHTVLGLVYLSFGLAVLSVLFWFLLPSSVARLHSEARDEASSNM